MEGIPQNPKEKVEELCRQFEIKVENDCADITSLSFEQVKKFLKALTDSDTVVLHGTNADDVYKCLETRQGHCSIKESGRKNAVYAAADAIVPISVAVLNRKYLFTKTKDLVHGSSAVGDKITFTFTPEIYELFKAQDPNLFSDGYVYALDKNNFVNAEDAGGEWHSETDQTPLLACKVSKNLAESLYITGTDHDTVFPKDYKKE